MSRRCASECRILRPVLVALVHGEHHPETWRLERHLQRCSTCRSERAALEETLALLENIPFARPEPGACASSSRWTRGSRREALLHAFTVSAGILIAAMLIWGEARRPPPRSAGTANVSSVAAAPSREPFPEVADFAGEGLDDALDRLERRLQAVGGVW